MGGKDGSAADFAADELLEWAGHTGPRAVAFSDVGAHDWYDSCDSVARLAAALNHELIIVAMPHGMIEEWRRRWQRNTRRYVELECAKLIKPWSTPDTCGRFCTKQKLAPLMQELPRCSRQIKLFPKQ